MKTNYKKLPGSKIELEVVLNQQEFKPYWDAAYERALGEVHLKGFRPGKAPRELADQVVDKDKVFKEAARSAIRWSLDEVTKENEWTIIDAPQIEVDDAALGLKYKTVLIVFPEVKLGNYQKIAAKIFSERRSVTVESKEIDEAMEWLKKSRSTKEKEIVLNDDFAKNLGKFETIDDLKKSVGEGIKMEKEMKERDRLRLKFIEELSQASPIDIPEIMIDKTEEQMKKRLAPMLKASGKSDDEIHKQLHERAKKNIELNLILYKIAEIEKLDYDPQKGIDNEQVFQYLESLAVK